jgi:hypothetical protein
MSHGRKNVLLAAATALILLLAGVGYLRPSAPREPVYRGKTLTRWLVQLDDGRAFGISSGALPSPTPAQVEAGAAIHSLGAGALPLLMKDLHIQPATNSFRLRFQDWLSELAERLSGRPLTFAVVTREDRIHWRAAQGLAALGPLALPALPELKRLLYTNYYHSSIKEAAFALAAIGPEGIGILTNAVQPTTEWSGMCAIWALGHHPAAGTNVIPFLVSAAASTSEGTASGAIQILGRFHTDAAVVLPALTRALTGANPSVSRDAARALGEFGPQAVSAVPLLQSLTNNPALKEEVLRALENIQRPPSKTGRGDGTGIVD